jgi:hypothetical protein
VTRVAAKLGMTKKKVVEFAVREFAASRSVNVVKVEPQSSDRNGAAA